VKHVLRLCNGSYTGNRPPPSLRLTDGSFPKSSTALVIVLAPVPPFHCPLFHRCPLVVLSRCPRAFEFRMWPHLHGPCFLGGNFRKPSYSYGTVPNAKCPQSRPLVRPHALFNALLCSLADGSGKLLLPLASGPAFAAHLDSISTRSMKIFQSAC